MVPTWRLIGLSAVVLPGAALLTLWREALSIHALLAVGVFVCGSFLDAWWGKYRLQSLVVTSASTVRMICEKWSALALTFVKPEAQRFDLTVIPILPDIFFVKEKVFPVLLNKGQSRVTVQPACLPHTRGRFPLTACHAGQNSPMGLWMVRRKYTLDCEIRVYPDLGSGRKHILGLFHNKDLGWRNLRKIGKGREFEQLREYLPGDSYEDIDWKATARRRYPITRDFEIEHSQEIYILLDASRLSTRLFHANHFQQDAHSVPEHDRPSYDGMPIAKTIFEHYLIGALILAMAADRAADRYGLLVFGARPEVFLKAARGKSHYNACLEALFNYMPQAVSPDFEEVFAFIGTTIRKRALLVFLSSLDDPLLSESFVNAMGAAARRHVIMVNMLRPGGAHPLFSTPLDDSGDKADDHPIYQKLMGHMVWNMLSGTRRKFKSFGAGFTLLHEHRLSSQLIDQYREIKQRQII